MRAAPTQFDRLMAAYPDLRGGRFAVIADFEDPKHMEIFQLVGVSPKAKCVLSERHGRAETGGGCAVFTVGSPDDTLLINNDRAENWYLKRDWRDYDLLLLGIESPQRGLTAEVSISAGPAEQPMAVHSSLRLERGWNLARLDLAEVGERIPLDEVRDIRFSIHGIRKPVKLRLDDIILAGSREDLFGVAKNRTGALYVQRAGRRWNIGAGGRFELTFANGQIVRWHNLEADPYRVRNLVQGTTLGPNLIVNQPGNEHAVNIDILGDKVVARSRILEASSVRAVVECEWRFVDDLDASQAERPFHRWVYTIYPSGQVYVLVESSAPSAISGDSSLGAVVSMVADSDGNVHTPVEVGRDADRSAPVLSEQVSAEQDGALKHPEHAPPIFASSRNLQGDAALLFVPGDQDRLIELVEELKPGQHYVSFTAVHEGTEADAQTWHFLMQVGTARELSETEVRSRAVGYVNPPELHMELGSFVPQAGPGTHMTGFDPTSGCYVVSPDRGRVRFTIDGRHQPSFSPAFQIISPPGETAWVYVNNLIFEDFARSASGNIIFQLPGTIRGEANVEVLFRNATMR